MKLAKISGTLHEFTYQHPGGSGWAVAQVEVDVTAIPPYVLAESSLSGEEDTALVTVTGIFASAKEGDRLVLEGEWVKHPEHGHQFKVTSWTWDSNEYADPQAMILYLGGGSFRHVGLARATQIVERFGAETYTVLDEQPEALLQIKGLTRERLDEFIADWRAQRGERYVMTYLRSVGLTPAYAVRVVAEWGMATQRRLEANPYDLCDVKGIGFKLADTVARRMGLTARDPRRIAAGLIYALEQSESLGNCCLAQTQLFAETLKVLTPPPEETEAADEPGPDAQALTQGLEQLMRMGGVFIEFDAVYTARMRKLEAESAAHVQVILQTDSALTHLAERATPELVDQAAAPQTLTDGQRNGILAALHAKLSILTGGPGTGKTFTLNTLVRLLRAARHSVTLAAPTGRAAKRMAESTGLEASTIHRLLGYGSGDDGGFSDEIVTADCVIIDEASMLDLWLFHSLLAHLPPKAHLVLVGDADQLPSVGAGYVLGDLIASGRVPVTRLDHIFRQGQASQIVTNAHLINQGQLPDRKIRAGSDCFFLEEADPARLAALAVDLVAWRIPNGQTPYPSEQIIVLAPMKKGPCGVLRLNELLQTRLNPPAPGKAEVRAPGGQILRVGDPVLNGKNNYDKEVFNGDIGLITRIDPGDDDNLGGVQVFFDDYGRTVTWTTPELGALSLARALTVHKAQGSEYPVVVAVLSSSHHIMLERQIFYTALTRARKMAVIVGDSRAIGTAVRTNRGKQRQTHLDDRLKLEAAPGLP
jgi:exodeoxyribonuclease V alpha subunit